MTLMRLGSNHRSPVNLGNPREFSVDEVAEMISGLVDGGKKIVRLPLPQDVPRQRRPDIARARELLQWRTRVPLEKGLAQTISCYRDTLRERRPELKFPKLHFIEASHSGDRTNCFFPNRAAVEAMLRSAGFIPEQHPERQVYICRRGRRLIGVPPPPERPAAPEAPVNSSSR